VPTAVLEAFGVTGRPSPLAGGRGTTWRAGDVVLKPLDASPEELVWRSELLLTLVGRTDVRVSRPLRTTSGAFGWGGWTASVHEPGRHVPGRWLDVVDAGRAFHAAVEPCPRPSFLAERTDPWSVGDRVAWRELPWEPYGASRWVRRLAEALRPVPSRPQLVHGDLTGNVLLEPGLPPLVIDLSPYWRPPAFASAVVVADALVFEGADEAALEPVLRQPDLPQHLLRALLYRVVTDHAADVGRAPSADDVYGPAVRLALRLAAAREG
jgi:uncharacterized protein (TIGR02569 family)